MGKPVLIHQRLEAAMQDATIFARRVAAHEGVRIPTVVILDACNARREARQPWIDTLESYQPPCLLKHVFSINFPDPGDDVLRTRIEQRKGHPTLHPSQAKEALHRMRRILCWEPMGAAHAHHTVMEAEGGSTEDSTTRLARKVGNKIGEEERGENLRLPASLIHAAKFGPYGMRWRRLYWRRGRRKKNVKPVARVIPDLW